MRYLSVCSGIESATCAWEHMGWEAAAFSEIEAFPSAVLKHHYPNVRNLGDMTKFKEWDLGTIDLLVGGTPCQSFSVAGLRKGLDDPRGNLMLTYLAIARRFSPRWIVWENVPGVLSSNGGEDFAALLRGLDECGYGWAYRVLDAQYFGVAQRRRRVFVVGYLGNWHRAAAVLFDRESVSGNPAPSRETGKRVAPSPKASPQYGGSDPNCADTVTSKWAKGSGGPAGNECGLFVAHTLRAEHDASEDGTGRGTPLVPVGIPEVMSTLLSSTAGISRTGNAATEHETYIPMAFGVGEQPDVAHCLRSQASKADKHESTTYVAQPIPFRKAKRAQTAEDDETWVDDGVANTINLFDQGDVRTTHAVVQPIVIRESGQGYWMEDDIAGTLRAEGENRQSRPSHVIGQPIAWDEELNATVDMAGTLLRGGQGGRRDGVVAFSSNMSVPDCQTDVSPTLKLGGQGGNPPAIAVDLYNQSVDGQVAATLTEACGGTNTSGPKVMQPIAFNGDQSEKTRSMGESVDLSPTLRADGPCHVATMAVRRLTPRECERLQGFGDDYTLIPWRGKNAQDCPDGPRYKALGNSMAVPVMAWIGKRIGFVDELPE